MIRKQVTKNMIPNHNQFVTVNKLKHLYNLELAMDIFDDITAYVTQYQLYLQGENTCKVNISLFSFQ